MAQSKLRSLRETLTGTFLGTVGSWLITFICLSFIHDKWLATTIATLGCTVWSITRGYTIRRWFNKQDSTSVVLPVVVHVSTSLNRLGERHWDWVERMGWHKSTILERLALVCSEVGEAVNECRGERPTEKFRYKLADIILRTVDLAHDRGIDLDKAVADKMAENEDKGNYKNRIV